MEEMIAEERESCSAQIRTLLHEQRKTTIAEYFEKVSHHELFAAQAEQGRRILQGEILRQQQDFREVHQHPTKMKELQKFQNSTFDEFAQKFIEDQKIIMELSGRLRDTESICSGNPHVTSPPGLFRRHPPFEGLLKPAFISQRQNEEPPNIRDTSGTSGNVFAHPQASSSAPYPQELNSTWRKTIEKNQFTCLQQRKVEDQNEIKIWDASLDRHPQIQSSSVEETILRIMVQTNNDWGSDLHFDKFPTPATFACWKIRFKTEVFTCSHFPTEAMQWIKEVE